MLLGSYPFCLINLYQAIGFPAGPPVPGSLHVVLCPSRTFTDYRVLSEPQILPF